MGYAWKRPDYTWSPAGFLPISIERFGVVTAGDEAPSDHYGLITEFPWPGVPPGASRHDATGGLDADARRGASTSPAARSRFRSPPPTTSA